MLPSQRPSASGLVSRALVTLGLALGLSRGPGGGPSGARAATSAAHLGRHPAQPFLRRDIESARPALMGIDSPGEACGGPPPQWVAALGSDASVAWAGIEEVPGVRPFSPEPDVGCAGLQGSNALMDEQEVASECARLPPSGSWGQAPVPESNSLAHLKLLHELDGQALSANMQSQSAPTHAFWPPSNKGPGGVAALERPELPIPPHASCDSFDVPRDCMTPFGLPFGAPSMAHAALRPDASFDPGTSLLTYGTLVSQQSQQPQHQRGGGQIAWGDTNDVEAKREQLLLRWRDADRALKRYEQPAPVRRVEENVREYISHARFAAGHRHAGHASEDGGKPDAAAWRCRNDIGEETCPGSPVSSGSLPLLQDPCGYWVQDGVDLCEEPPADFNLGRDVSPWAMRRDGSSCDLWSTVEGDEGDASSNYLELGNRARHVQENVMDVRASGDLGENSHRLWCERFVPRPLQLEFARELRWFAWQGREGKQSRDGGDGEAYSAPNGAVAKLTQELPNMAKVNRRGPKPQVCKQQPMPTFSRWLPRALSAPTAASLHLSNPLMHTKSVDQDCSEGDCAMDDIVRKAGEKMTLTLESNEPEDRIETTGLVSRRQGVLAPNVSWRTPTTRKNSPSRSLSSLRKTTPRRSGSSTRMSMVSQHHASPALSQAKSTSPEKSAIQLWQEDTTVISGCESSRHDESGRGSGLHSLLQSGDCTSDMRLDQVQMFKIREMLREMHRAIVSQPALLLEFGDGSTTAPGTVGADASVQKNPGGWLMWRLIMYNAMMHAQSQVAAAGHASVGDGIAILDRMSAAGVSPTLSTFNRYLHVIAGAANHGHGNGTHVDDALFRMAVAGIEPDRETYWAWLSVLGSAVFYGQAGMQQIYWVLQSINSPSGSDNVPAEVAMMEGAPVCGREAMAHEDIKCLRLCLRAAVGGAERGLAGKADVEWVFRRLRALQLKADHDTWLLAMQVIAKAAQRGQASVTDAERLLEKAEAEGYVASPSLYCAFFQAAAAAANSRKHKYALDARERVLARLERLERVCQESASQPFPLQQSLLSLTQAVRAYAEQEGFGKTAILAPKGASAKCRKGCPLSRRHSHRGDKV